MATTITEVQGNHINHCMAVDLTLGGTTYHISGAWKPFTYAGNTYTELGSFISVGQIPEDIKTTNGDIQLSLSGIPSEQDYMSLILSTQIKGGEVTIYRAFFDDDYETASVYQRYKGIITNFSIQEDTDIIAGKNTNTVSISCASINAILEAKVAGQRTNLTDRQKYYPTDNTFNRVADLHRVSFDFGREYTGGTNYGGRPGIGPGIPGLPGPGFNPFLGINIY